MNELQIVSDLITESHPVFNRASGEMPKPCKELAVDNYLGTVGDSALFIIKDLYNNKKPDKLLSLDFKEIK